MILVPFLNPKFAPVPAARSCELRVRGTRRRSAGNDRAARQRIVGIFLESSHFLDAETRLVDDEVSSERRLRGQLLDRESQAFRGGIEPHVSAAALARSAAARKQFGRGAVVEAVQALRLSAGLLANAVLRFDVM